MTSEDRIPFATIGYVPPPGIGYPATFLENIRRFKTRHPIFLSSEHPWPGCIKLKCGPEIAKQSGNRWPVANMTFLTALRIAQKNNIENFLFIEPDCRVGRDEWDEVVYQEWLQNGCKAVSGSVMGYGMFNHSREVAERWNKLVAASGSRLPIPNFGKGGQDNHTTPCLAVNGALGVFNTAKMLEMFNVADGMSAAEAVKMAFAWDIVIGRRLWEKHGIACFDMVAHLNSIHSSYGNNLTSENERIAMLQQGTFVAVHQVKSDWGSSKTANNEVCIVQLGRYGDIINLLPAVRRAFQQTGKKPVLCVAKGYESLLDGVTYCKLEIYDGEFKYPSRAAAQMKGKYANPVITQCYDAEAAWKHNGTTYNMDSWSKAGIVEGKWGESPLVFDNRDHNRERELLLKLGLFGKKYVVTHFSGKSSPFKAGPLLLESMRKAMPDVQFVELDSVFAERVYDLIPVLEQAEAIVCIDSMVLHLAAAVGTPVVALITDTPSLWHGTAPRCNVVASERYGKANLEFVVNGVETALKVQSPIYHLSNWYSPRDPEVQRRERMARLTWTELYRAGKMKPIPFDGSLAKRDGRDIGDHLDVPFIKDVVDYGVMMAGASILAMSNTDSCFLPEVAEEIADQVSRHGCYFSYRIDFPRIDAPKTASDVAGKMYPGADLFAFSAAWWALVRDNVPDILMGREGWDFVMKALMIKSGFKARKPMVYHEAHDSDWIVKPQNAGQILNAKLCREWAVANGYEKYLFPEGGRFLFKVI